MLLLAGGWIWGTAHPHLMETAQVYCLWVILQSIGDFVCNNMLQQFVSGLVCVWDFRKHEKGSQSHSNHVANLKWKWLGEICPKYWSTASLQKNNKCTASNTLHTTALQLSRVWRLKWPRQSQYNKNIQNWRPRNIPAKRVKDHTRTDRPDDRAATVPSATKPFPTR